jgi:phosphoribosylanthranilate isomerase
VTWVKVCGLREPESLEAALAAGVDAVGFVLAESPRRVAPDALPGLSRLARGRALRVAVFRSVAAGLAAELVHRRLVDLVQAERFTPRPPRVPVLLVRALELGEAFRPEPDERPFAYVLDRRVGGRTGGTGCLADWEVAAQAARTVRLVLAGGLTPENVAAAIARVRPFGVDVSGGVETDGRKDPARIVAFVAAVRRATRTEEGRESLPRGAADEQRGG